MLWADVVDTEYRHVSKRSLDRPSAMPMRASSIMLSVGIAVRNIHPDYHPTCFFFVLEPALTLWDRPLDGPAAFELMAPR